MKKQLKIAMLIDGWNPVFGGGQVHVDNLCDNLVLHHHCCADLFVRKLKDEKGTTYDKSEKRHREKLCIYRVGPTARFFNPFGRLFSLIATTYVLYKKTKKYNYDIIHAHAYVSGIPAYIVGKLTNTPTVYTVHGTMNLDNGKKGCTYFLEKFLVTMLKYNKEISVSSQILDYNNVNDVTVIPNGVDIEKYDAISVKQKQGGISFLWVGRYNWQKGLKYLIEGISQIDKKLLDTKGFHLHLVGDGELKGEIEKMIKNYGLEHYITLDGTIYADALIEQYKKNHIFILPSLSEGQPLTVLEAFASGLPVIATRVGDNAHFVNKKNGFLISPGSAKEIKNIIEKVLKTDTLNLTKMGENGYNLVKKNYSWDIMSHKTREQYDLLIK